MRTSDLRPCNVALVRVPHGRHGATLVVEKHVAPYIRRIDARYLADPRSHQYPIRPKVTGAYNCRKTTSGSSWSKHSYGCACDINWDKNPYGRKLVTDMPKWYIQLWKDEGFGWGGDWESVKDAMHFSKFPNEGGDGRLDGGGTSKEWDEMASKEEIEAVVQKVVAKELDARVGKVYAPGLTVLHILTEKDPKSGKYVDGIKLIRREMKEGKK